MKLYKARVCIYMDLMIAGEKPPDDDEVMGAVRLELNDNWLTYQDGMDNDVELVTPEAGMPKGWENAIPYGDDHNGSRTCLQILDDYVPDQEPLGEQLSIPADNKDYLDE
jgi:hypothetical protein